MTSRRISIAALVALLVVSLVPAALAEEGDKKLRFGLLYALPTDELDDPTDPAELDPSLGLQASFEYLVTDSIGVEPAIANIGYDGEITNANPLIADREVEVMVFMATANVNFHLLSKEKLDLYIGPSVGYAAWSDLEVEGTADDVSTDDSFVYGLNAGIDVMLGSSDKWSFNATLNYLVSEFELEGSTGDDFGVSPVQLKFGAAYKF